MRITLLLACLICTNLIGQELKKKKKTGEIYQEIFTIDKSSKKNKGIISKLIRFQKILW